MRKFELAGLLILALLLIYRVFFGLELQVILRIVLTVISIFYLWFGFFIFNRLSLKDLFFTQKVRQICLRKLTTSIVSGFVYSFSFISILFVVNFYKGMQSMSLLSLILNLGLILISIFMLLTDKEINLFSRQYLWRSVFLFVLFFFVVRTPVEKRLNILYKEHPRFIEAYHNYLQNPDDLEVQNRLKEERSTFR